MKEYKSIFKEDEYRIIVECEEMIDEVENHLKEAIDILKELSRKGRKIKNMDIGPFTGQIEHYIIGHLKDWIENENQPGSLASLRMMLNRDDEPKW